MWQMRMVRPRVAVIGAGIIGLHKAVLLTDISCKPEVTLISEKFSPDTTSDISGAIMRPADGTNIGSADKRRLEWTRLTFQYLYNCFTSPLASKLGLSLNVTYDVFCGDKKDPWWKDHVLGFRHVGEEEMKLLHYPMGTKCWTYSTLLMPCQKYLSWQMEELKAKGGIVVQKRLKSLQEIDGQYDIIVNCTGLGSRELVNDDQMYPVRGQVILVKAPWMKHAFISMGEDNIITYVLPRADDVLLGGTQEIGDWSEQVDPLISKGIMERCCKYVPALATAPVIREAVGLRPGRKTVRLEVDDTITKHSTVIHNYGHGGQGVTFFRGCVLDAVKLVEESLLRRGFVVNSNL